MDIGFIGVGNMGNPMATRLLDGGHRLTVHDIREDALTPFLERQAQRADSPKETGDRSEIVCVSLPTLATLRQVVLADGGLLAGARLKLLVNTCTVGMPLVAEIEQAAAKRGIRVVDACISGGPAGAAAGTLSVMVSGAPEDVALTRPLFECWGSRITVAGDRPGAAQALKLTNNVLAGVALMASSEAFVMGAKAGLKPQAMVDAINAGSGRNVATLEMFPRSVLPGSFDYGAEIVTLLKDMDLAIQQGEALGVPMWVCQAARLAIKHVVFEGRGGDDITTLFQAIERGARFEMPKGRN